jgi:hypothetical protein
VDRPLRLVAGPVARPWSPSLVLIDRMIAMSFICPASLGRCCEILMPGAAVSIAWNGPPCACPGLGSNVSVWLGPPVIHRRMHDFRRFGSAAAEAASVSIQPEAEAPMAPAEANRITCRRVKRGAPRSDGFMASAPSGTK